MIARLSERIGQSAVSLSGLIATLAVSIPTVWFLFSERQAGRWIALALIALFILLTQFRGRGNFWNPGLTHLYFAAQALIIVLVMRITPGSSWMIILFFVLSGQAPALLSTRAWVGWIAAFSLITGALLLAYSDQPTDLIFLPIYVGGFFFFAGFAHQTVEARYARRESVRLLDELQAAHSRLQAYAVQAQELAVAEERNRLAREMHDTLGHRLTVSSVQLQAAERLVMTQPQRTLEIIATARGQISEAMSDLRGTVATLRTPLEADLPLIPALKRLVAEFEQATGLTVHLLLPDHLPVLPHPYHQALYRSAQESLTNVQKHARATAVWLQLSLSPDTIDLLVRDNGIGLATPGKLPATGFGLAGLRERASQLGGNFCLDQSPDGGLALSVRLPKPPGVT